MKLQKCCKRMKTTLETLLVVMICVLCNGGYLFQTEAQEMFSKVDYGSEAIDGKYFYGTDAIISLEMTEQNYLVNKANLRYRYDWVQTGGQIEKSPKIRRPVWEYDEEAKKAAVSLCFPAAEGTEQEYRFYFEHMLFPLNAKDSEKRLQGRFRSEVLVVDSLAPVLESFEILPAGEKPLERREKNLYYVKNNEKGAVKIELVINDNGKYFEKNKVRLEYRIQGEDSWKSLKLQNWKSDDRRQTLQYLFSGDSAGVRTYEFRVCYKDCAGNWMKPGEYAEVFDGLEVLTAKNKVMIDHCTPELSELTFSGPVQMFCEGVRENVIRSRETRMYYQEEAEVAFGITDEDFLPENVALIIYHQKKEENQWKKKAVYKGTDILEEGRFVFKLPHKNGACYFTIAYTDPFGNEMIYGPSMVTGGFGENYNNGIQSGVYTSPVFVMDSRAPEIAAERYTTAEGKKLQVNNQTDWIKAEVYIREENLDLENTKVTVRACDRNGKSLGREEEETYSKTWGELAEAGICTAEKKDLHKLTMELRSEANYKIFIICGDKAKGMAVYEKNFSVDRTAPKIEIVYPENQNGRKINKNTYQYFAKDQTSIYFKLYDQVSGVKSICCAYPDEKGKVQSKTVQLDSKEQGDKNSLRYELELPAGLKGTVTAYAADWTGNREIQKESISVGIITESEKQHKNHAELSIEVTGDYAKIPGYYNEDVKVCFRTKDEHSGIREIFYLAGKQLNKTDDSYGGEGREIEDEEIEFHYVISAGENNQNHVPFGLRFLDNTGHLSELAKDELPVIHMDVTKPEVEVFYDNSQVINENYYQRERIATVRVKERNFDLEDVKFHLTGPDVFISRWNHSGAEGCRGGNDPKNTGHQDRCQWSCTIHFVKDGDYSFGFECVDLAGNKGCYQQTDTFVIDKTIPVIAVAYDNMDGRNGSYYQAPRRAEIQILEHNFDKKNVTVTMTAERDGQKIHVPEISGWKSADDIHKAEICFKEDAKYTLQIRCRDLAGNFAEEYKKEEFVIDLTAPKIEITEVLDGSANSGRAAPMIKVTDANYDDEGVAVTMEGSHRGTVRYQSTKTKWNHGKIIRIEDFQRVKEADDLYTLTASATDLAGNCTEKKITFSVNRFGSVYTFDQEMDGFYRNRAPELVITETNVDTLEFLRISCSRNGQLEILKEGEDYTVATPGDASGWKQYIYRISRNCFKTDGHYLLTIYSIDRASNVSENHSKGKKIEFVLDTEAPTLLIAGVEDQMQYRESSRRVVIHAEDNVALKEVIVRMGDIEKIYSGAEMEDLDGKIVFDMGSSKGWQNLTVEAADMAGNEPVRKEISVLINTSRFLHFFYNKSLFYGSLSAVLCGFVTAGILMKKNSGKGKHSS